MNNYLNDNGLGGRTPLGMETPIVRFPGGSIHNPNKSSYYGGGGMSPGFQTPNYYTSQREFSEHNRFDELRASSPMPMTPLLLNPSTTPLIGGLSNMSPLYNPGNTSFHGNSIHRPSSQARSPNYYYQSSASSSPNYSSFRSHSPDYNSPMASSGRYGNSPNYSISPMDQNRGYFKDEENDFEEDDE